MGSILLPPKRCLAGSVGPAGSNVTILDSLTRTSQKSVAAAQIRPVESNFELRVRKLSGSVVTDALMGNRPEGLRTG
jgi:hypothetical protein